MAMCMVCGLNWENLRLVETYAFTRAQDMSDHIKDLDDMKVGSSSLFLQH